MCKSGKSMILNIFSYCVHTERKSFEKYIMKNDIFTLLAEKRFCVDKIKETESLIQELHELKSPKLDSKYRECKYIEKRSDTSVLDFFDNNSRILFAIMIVVIIVVYVL